ncbi:DEAD/DEAH box helicase [Paracrocinitomix mangrovi]|uniref:DEAD/DEAH box helicase n=1 Tax=Paracrocinitomix mangrovi TaxID=2862509 RepID=UPI001C8D1792|nr:DEAD/DEAH box helicase [Paracrocinitomix mangrovi]UKN02447.1 DEAD/DEAH box helicase [Paracrocinitomix mangrovi]
MKFSELELEEQLLDAISYMGFENATPIQEKAIPEILANKDLLACAQTGTGKTAAFVLPILNKLINKSDNSINTLIIVPTRELAIQIEQQIQGISYFTSVGSQTVYGGGDGKDWEIQKAALKSGTDIIVATPGKLISHLKLGYVNFKNLQHLVLDEADRMLDMGFIDDIKKIISHIPKKRQTLMFSATMPDQIRSLAKHILHQPVEISLSISKPAEGVTQKAYLCHDDQKLKILDFILKEREDYDSIIIFSSTKQKVFDIVQSLKRRNYMAEGISSNLEQSDREEVLRGFRSKRIRILVATDVMSRGIDIKGINMVINYDTPSDAEDYVHRVGRTARAKSEGEAFTLINSKDMVKFSRIEKLIGMEIEKLAPPTDFGEGPEWKVPERNKNKKRNFKHKHKSKNHKHKNSGKKGNNNPKKT